MLTVTVGIVRTRAGPGASTIVFQAPLAYAIGAGDTVLIGGRTVRVLAPRAAATDRLHVELGLSTTAPFVKAGTPVEWIPKYGQARDLPDTVQPGEDPWDHAREVHAVRLDVHGAPVRPTEPSAIICGYSRPRPLTVRKGHFWREAMTIRLCLGCKSATPYPPPWG